MKTADYRLSNLKIYQSGKGSFILPALFLWGIVLIVASAFYLYEYDLYDPQNYYYLFPWCLLTGAVVSAPSLYLLYKKEFNPFHPLVFASWSYFFPAFFIGGIALAAGISQPYYLNFIQDEYYNLPLTLVYVMLGYISLTIGFYIPFGGKIGKRISDWLPVWNWKPEQITLPAVVLLGIGLANNAIAFTSGLIGYQRVAEIGMFDGLLVMLTLIWMEATFLLWLIIFRSKSLNFNHYLIIALTLGALLLKAAFQGGRSGLLHIVILMAFAYILSGKKLKLKHGVFSGFVVCLALIVGMIYGTTFRSVKQSTDQVSVEEYAGNIGQTFEKISDQDLIVNLEGGFAALAERLDAVSSLGVVVANYEKLAPYEESYGLDNNIWKDSIAFLIPRLFWADKTIATDPSKYGDLYFNFSENAFTLTPIGDLLRNFGPIGIPIGMVLLGLFIRVIYSALLENQEFSFWRATLYYMLLTNISYEGSYGLIFPYLTKVCFIAMIGLLFVWFFVKKMGGTGKIGLFGRV